MPFFSSFFAFALASTFYHSQLVVSVFTFSAMAGHSQNSQSRKGKPGEATGYTGDTGPAFSGESTELLYLIEWHSLFIITALCLE